MYKDIPGNFKYKISLSGEIISKDNKECAPVIKDGQVTICLYGVVKVIPVLWLSLLSYYEVNLPKKHMKELWKIKFIDIDGVITKSVTNKRMVFNKPLDMYSGFRIIPNFTNYCINNVGIVKNIITGDIMPLCKKMVNGYPVVYIYNPEKNSFRTERVHRLVALAWVYNSDPMKYYMVNHKDGNKHNPHASNLEWTDYSGNNSHAFNTGLRNDNKACVVRDITIKETVIFPSLTQACAHMGISVRRYGNLIYKRKVKLINNRYELRMMGDSSPWVYNVGDKPKANGRYNFHVTYPDNRKCVYYDVKALREALKLKYSTNNSAGVIVYRVLQKHPELKIEIVDTYETMPIQALCVETDVITEANSVCDLARLLNKHRGTIKYSLEAGETRVTQGYAYRYKSSNPWNKNFTKYQSRTMRILATNSITNETKEFKSLRDAELSIKLNRKAIRKCLKTNKSHNNWMFKEI